MVAEHANEQRHPRIRAITDLARERHDALTDAIARLEHALAAAATQRARAWSERVASELALVRKEIRAHVDSIEGPRGLFDELRSERPRLARRVDEIAAEHASLVKRAAPLAAKLNADVEPDFNEVRREAAHLLAALRGHRAAEADLIYEAFWIDLGSPD